LIFSDQLFQAERHLTSALENASRRGSMLSFALLSAWRAFARLRLGEVIRGLSDAETASRLADELGILLDRPFVVAALANLLRARDQKADASHLLEHFPVEDFMDAGSASVLLHSRGLSRIAGGRMVEGLDDLLECGRHLTAWEAPNPIVLPWRSDAAIVMGAMGENAAARRLAEEELDLAERYGAKSAIGIALHGCALLAPEPRKEKLLREALSALEGTQARLAYIRVQISLGAALRGAGQLQNARECLLRSLDESEQRAAAALAAQARAELIASGARPRRAAIRGADALTPSERQIAEMAAEGRSNREIAHALFLTVRTVEMHLTGAYRKLGIASRTQLAGLFE
jgi:DNA-binding CsgD family transcriptional regulator